MAGRNSHGFKLTMVRHGETEMNRLGVLQGQGVNPGLNEDGRDQARALGRHLSTDVFTHVYASDLLRAKETCEIIVAENNDFSQKSNEIQFDQRLRERSFGILEGKTWRDLSSAARSAGKHSSDDFCPEGGETMMDMRSRAVSFFLDLCDNCFEYCSENSDEMPNVLVVCHGGLLFTLIGSFSENFGCSFPRGKRVHEIAPNTGRSCFAVHFQKRFKPRVDEAITSTAESDSHKRDTKTKIVMKCTMLNNCDHMSSMFGPK